MNYLPLPHVRPVSRDSRQVGFLISLAFLLIIAFIGARLLFSAGPSAIAANQNPPSCCGSDDTKPHVLLGSYYSVKDRLSSKLLLNNKGPRPLEVRARLFSLNGERFDAPSVMVDAESFRMMDIRDWVNVAGTQFEQGSIEVFHLGRDLVLGSQIYILDEGHSLSFDEKLGEVSAFKSSRLEGVWWQPTHAGNVQLALANTTSSPVTITIKASGHEPERTGYEVIQLGSRETHLLDVQEDVMHLEHGAISKYGGISIEHSGSPGAILARGMVSNPETGYSFSMQFSDPAAAKSNNVQGVGLRLGTVGDEALTPIVIFRNVGSRETVITERLPFTKESGDSSIVNLPILHLGGGEMEVVDIRRWLIQHGRGQLKATAGLETSYTGDKGNVIVSALSVSGNGNQLFRVPMWDVAAQRSSTGGYPWYIDGNSSTTVYIKNAEPYEQHYYLQLNYQGGVYSTGIKPAAAAETIVFDIRKLRDDQVPDARGNMIPLNAASGQVHWSSVGPERGMLIGRSEQADNNLGYSSNYACMNCCPNNPGLTRVVEDTTVDVGGSHTFIAQEALRNCYGGYDAYLDIYGATWISSNLSVATVDFDGVASAQGGGEAQITASWNTDHYAFGNNDPPGTPFVEPIGGMGGCEVDGYNVQTAHATLTVRPTVNRIQYQSGNDFVDTTNPLYVLKGTSVTFKAIPNPGNASWPSGKPTWSGTAGASGTGATKSLTFNTISSSTNEFKTITATSGNTVTVNVIVFELSGILTLPAVTDFVGRSHERFGIEEAMELSFSATPSLNASQLGGLRWSITTAGSGNGTLQADDDGAATYLAPDTGKAISFALQLLSGPSKDQGPSLNIEIVEPSSGFAIKGFGGIRHTFNTWSVGFLGDIHIGPSDVSFFNLSFYEGAAPVNLSGWLNTNQFNFPHAQSAQAVPIDNRNIADKQDEIWSGEKAGPYGNGYWYWDIPWHVVTQSGRNITFTTVRQIATSDESGTAVISKGGPSESKPASASTTFW